MKLSLEEKEARKLARQEKRKQEKEAARIEAEKNQPAVKSIQINIEWKKSRIYGWNPHAEALVEFKEEAGQYGGRFRRFEGFTCSGCGYDKESTVIADIFNRLLKYKLYLPLEGVAPYGMYHPSQNEGKHPNSQRDWRCYNGGVGVSCYYDIAEFIGGKFEKIASGKSFDCYKYTDNQ